MAAAATLFACAPRHARPPEPALAGRCFDLSRLGEPARATAERFVLAAGDREALYTLDGGLKPVSSDIADFSWRVHPTADPMAADTLSRWREAASALSCGDLTFAVQVFAAVYPARDGDSVRTASVAVGHRTSIDATITRHAAFFAAIGITPGLPLGELLGLVDVAPRDARWRAYGLLFGYPEPAVDFFVTAGRRGDATRSVEPRDFRRFPTWRKFAPPPGTSDSLTSFVYAVPRGAPWSAEDSVIGRLTAERYARYRTWRAAAPRSGADAVRHWRATLTTGGLRPAP